MPDIPKRYIFMYFFFFHLYLYIPRTSPNGCRLSLTVDLHLYDVLCDKLQGTLVVYFSVMTEPIPECYNYWVSKRDLLSYV